MINVSIVVPVYNAEVYIERCAISLFEQTTMNNIEFVFINDCTRDSSMDILKQTLLNYPHRKHQVVFLSNTLNIGSAATRQIGIVKAKGKYILCIDSDDYVEKDMIEIMYNSSLNNNSDIVLTDYLLELSGRTIYKKQEPISVDGKICMNQVLSMQLHGAWWNKLIKKDLLKNEVIHIESRRDMLEDLMYTFQLFYFSARVTYVNRAFYHYVYDNPTSQSKVLSKEKLESMLYAYDLVDKFYRQNNIVDEDAVSAKCFFRISTLSAVALCEQKGDFSINYKQYNLLSPYVIKHPKLSIGYKIVLYAKIKGLMKVANMLLFIRKLIVLFVRKANKL